MPYDENNALAYVAVAVSGALHRTGLFPHSASRLASSDENCSFPMAVSASLEILWTALVFHELFRIQASIPPGASKSNHQGRTGNQLCCNNVIDKTQLELAKMCHKSKCRLFGSNSLFYIS